MTGRIGQMTTFWVCLALPAAGLPAQKFLPDDPIVRDCDDLPIERPAQMIVSPSFDALENLIGSEARGPMSKAANVNTLGEVPDSSWFTNRIGVGEMSIEELLRGPAGSHGPDTGGVLTIQRAGLLSIPDGLVVIDRGGDRYFLKFDRRLHPRLASAADVIASRFFHAAGYHTVPAHLVDIDATQLEIDPSARVTRLGESVAPLDADYLRSFLEGAARLPDGRYRAVANHLPDGEIVGGFKFYGARSDDPNDIFPHEDRRELRALRVFSEWLNFTGVSAVHTLDVLTNPTERPHLRHHLFDFRTALGSGRDFDNRIIPKDRRDGHEYALGFNRRSLKTALTLGIWERPWMTLDFPYPRHAEAGRIEAEFFEPGRWKPTYPNPAFDKMRADDAFWAATILARLSGQAIRAVVAAGGLSDPEAEAYLADVLIRRRDKVVAHYFRRVNPLTSFRVAGPWLEFEDLGVSHGVAASGGYQYQWFAFDNAFGTLTALQEPGTAESARIRLPSPRPEYLMVRIRTSRGQETNRTQAIDVYLRNHDKAPPRPVGVERQDDS